MISKKKEKGLTTRPDPDTGFSRAGCLRFVHLLVVRVVTLELLSRVAWRWRAVFQPFVRFSFGGMIALVCKLFCLVFEELAAREKCCSFICGARELLSRVAGGWSAFASDSANGNQVIDDVVSEVADLSASAVSEVAELAVQGDVFAVNQQHGQTDWAFDHVNSFTV